MASSGQEDLNSRGQKAAIVLAPEFYHEAHEEHEEHEEGQKARRPEGRKNGFPAFVVFVSFVVKYARCSG